MGYEPQVLGFEGVSKSWIWFYNNAKSTVDTFRNQGKAFTAGVMQPAQIKPKFDSSDVYN